MNKSVIETERLILRPMDANDSEAAFAWLGNPVVNKYLSYPLYTNVEEVRDLLEVEDSNNVFGIELKETSELIGSCVIGPEGNDAEWEFGYSFCPEFWNNGYATEALKALIKFAYDLGIRDFCAPFAIDNPASGKVMEKCGLHFDHYGEFTKDDGSATFKSKYYKMHLD
ncbi:GNAT family N-acetyltransferase [Clostridium sp. UBA6640]|uniref:GNAT family N-acetyltransferase n=1 Tax=Clostridium sp. UBA6640 TaxID=1946370 RepID=UPI0025BFB359|nr:GNAT family N-acetyltransferase [Clostridium sp. UBA6640]